MILPGVASVTFRKLSARQVVEAAAKAKLAGIEWGGDIHVPHGRADVAREVAAMTRDAGVAVSSYGSYYRLGQETPEVLPRVVETAVALGAPIIRVWAGGVASRDATAEYRTIVESDGRCAAELAQQVDLRVATEWHGNTLTDTAESARALLDAVGHPCFKTYWQPLHHDPSKCLSELEVAMPDLVGLHVYWEDPASGRNRPLAEGAGLWQAAFHQVALRRPAGQVFAMLEFVMNDSVEQMLDDAAAMRAWLDQEKLRCTC
ncbi:MAG: TIM barrel protein [Planctomycetota bacterium]|nr:TIM barrel protein [Planctomycetota bacterium]